MPRLVQPEILDALPACNPDAIASRRDLVKINHLMGNFRWFNTIIKSQQPQARYIEIGAGDGSLAKRLCKLLPPGNYDALDIAAKPRACPNNCKWIVMDLLQYPNYTHYTHLIANLILHHFNSSQLSRLGTHIQNSGIQKLIICEPCRRAIHKLQLRAGKYIGFNYVTLNDGCISVDAGFRGHELAEQLGLSHKEWAWHIDETWMGAYRLLANRK
ncbi:class I SAM-dependent methyltransferase [Coraliomargarita sp. SDUM461004]|uniref:Class I SAM-dependent methyltransferase n=1 Tax=Thalassobacterium sedimentorum TaxID=3041258 RepID=A0ABU1AHL3_9BACT|nr:class I SAM-dependent methyltransferase [Coraliomargarita sp. SDUM461004]MDQ8194278.1 class I SAM-dependent methyltransferase [Coraliomargarita sp. SDUM461004]